MSFSSLSIHIANTIGKTGHPYLMPPLISMLLPSLPSITTLAIILVHRYYIANSNGSSMLSSSKNAFKESYLGMQWYAVFKAMQYIIRLLLYMV